MWTSMDSPVGELRIIANRTAITAIEFAGPAPAGASPHSSMSRAAAVSLGRPVGDRDDAHPLLVEAVRQLRAYFDGELKEFDLPLEPAGTPFQLSVWEQAARHRLRRDGVVRRRGRPPGHAPGRVAGGGAGQRAEPDPDRDPVPPGGRRERHAHRVRRRVERKQQLLDLEQGALF